MVINNLKSKKGFVQGFAYMIAILFAIALIIVMSKFIFNGMNDAGAFATAPEAQAIANTFTTQGYSAYNSMFLGIFVAGFLFLAVIGFQEPVRTNRAFFPISIFLILPLMTFVATIISNVYMQFRDNSTWAGAEAGTTMMIHLMDNLPFYTFGMMIIVLLVIYGVNKSEGN